MNLAESFLNPDYSEIKQISETQAEVILEPLERGFGHTLGNALRRVLLSSIPGSAVVSVYIEGVEHEYSTIDGVREDVLDIFLNLKQLSVKLHEEEEVELKISCKGPKVITAADIELPHNVEIINKDLVIATLTQKIPFNMTLRIANGFGYESAGDRKNKQENQDVNVLYIDSFFSPIRQVNYHVDRTRQGDRTDLDKLKIELETNGTLTPKEAINFAATILHRQLTSFVDIRDFEEKIENRFAVTIDPIYLQSVEELELTVRSKNCLRAAEISTIGELVQKRSDELMRISNFGRKSLVEIQALLAQDGLELGTTVEGWPPPNLAQTTQ